MQSRRSVLRALGVSTVFGASGCLDAISASGEGPKNTSREIIDGFGREVPVPERAERVVGVGPGSLRQIAYLGATDRVVGVEDADPSILWAPYNLANRELRENRVIGSAGPNAGGNSEEILAVDPDVILYYGDSSRAESLQSQTDTPVVGLEIVDFVDRQARETMFDTWRLVGDVLGKEDRAETLIGFVRETIEDLRTRADGIAAGERTRAYVGAISYKGAHGIATTRKRFAPFHWTGVENVAGGIDTDAPSVQVSDEQLLAWDPETMFVSASNLGRAREDAALSPEYDSIRAVETGETYSILPHATYHHNYGSILANAYFVGKTVYPDRFDDVNVEATTNEIFETMLGTGLYAELLETYDAFQRLEFR
ncbi:ABC transporter substrate-binding protein [Halorhabdus sp. CBA1104]|uniref:ABC transporter substrate-binding protein n=1 Tax=Halorhabdus sp. CBA1104 TaxID=1380432 RepID=UPI0012B41BE6|nr:ABC transporter substrate-binding protein [Halorhabdus sp. CBA1104]QGN06759.1 ABC transporter substrate-binding protein [Halorhabdus sp. CBA1104]